MASIQPLNAGSIGGFFRAVINISHEKHTPWFLRGRRYTRRCTRALLGPKLPHWAKDLSGVSRFLNNVPTLGVFLANPWHLFRRISQVLAGLKPWYNSPFKYFAAQALTTIVLIEYFRPADWHHITEALVRGSVLSWLPKVVREYMLNYAPLAIAVIATPVWMLLIAFVMLLLTTLYEAIRRLGNYTPLDITIDSFDIVLNPYLYLVPLDPHTYFRMRWPRLLWGMFYYGLFALPVVAAFSSLQSFVWKVRFDATKIPAFGFAAGCIFLAFQRILIVPYVCMLRFGRTAPTRLMVKSDLYVITQRLNRLRLREKGRMRRGRSDSLDRWLLKRASVNWTAFRRRFTPEVVSLRQSSPESANLIETWLREELSSIDPVALERMLRSMDRGPKNRQTVERMVQEIAAAAGVQLPEEDSERILRIVIERLNASELTWIGKTVRIIDPLGIEIRAERTLDAPQCRTVASEQYLHIKAVSEIEGRQWFEVDEPDGSLGYALAASVRSRTAIIDAVPK